jgi:hypothetical protein
MIVMRASYLLSFFAGLILFGQAGLWFQLFEFSHFARLGFLSAAYSVGILLGLRLGVRFSSMRSQLWEVSGFAMLAASFFNMLSPWFYAAFVPAPLRVLVGGMLIVLMATLQAMIFPLAWRLDSISLMLWKSIPRVYGVAVGGAVLGVALTEGVLLDLLPVWNCFAFFAMVALGVSFYCFQEESLQPVDQVMMKLFVAVICGFIVLQETVQLFSHVGADLVAENPAVLRQHDHAIAVAKTEPQSGVFIFGGDRLDVQAGLDPLVGSDPVLMLSLLREPPKKILMIGLSARAWLKLVTRFSGVKNIDVVGINLGHLAAINAYSRQKKLVMDARVHLSFDDERRWLKHHPRERYDLIVENTACYWRACAAKLLSREFNAMTRARLQGAGAVAYNAVGARYVLSAGVG